MGDADLIDETLREREGRSLARVQVLADLLDNAIRIPGTEIRIGLDPIIGLVPGIGDLAGAALSIYIVLEGARAGVPRTVLLRMLANVGVDSLVGSIPALGDLFDFGWKANAKNAQLLRAHLEEPQRTSRASGLFVALVLLAVLLLAAGGFVLTVLLLKKLLT
jgi:hypothetical protein